MSLDLSIDIAVASFDLPCHTADPEMFFSDLPSTLEQAKLVCAPCPLRAECLAGALERREPHGVWGGEIFAEGVVIARKRPRGRPRKHPIEVPAAARAAERAA